MRIRSSDNKSGSRKVVLFLILLIIAISAFGAKDNIKKYLNEILSPSKNEIKEALKQIIIEDPQFIVNSFKESQAKEMENVQKEINAKIHNSKNEIEKSDLTPSAGKEESDIRIVYFFDYNCGYCKKANKTLHNLIAKHQNLRIIYKELPILGTKSKDLARAALAIYSLDKAKYPMFHDALMSEEATKEDSVDKIVKSLGINKLEFEEALKNPKIEEELDKINMLASKISVAGTPAFIINDELIPGADEYVLDRRIEQIRKKVATTDEKDENKDEAEEK